MDPNTIYPATPETMKVSSITNCKTCLRRRDYPEAYPVLPEGPLDAEYVFIGRDPGEAEMMNRRPFYPSAPGGRLFAEYLKILGLSREETYLTNVCFCRGLKNRPLEFSEAATCTKWKTVEFRSLSRVRIVFPLGNDAYQACLGWKESSILDIIGQLFSMPMGEKRVLVIPILHMGYLLRNPFWKKFTVQQLTWIKSYILDSKENYEGLITGKPRV